MKEWRVERGYVYGNILCREDDEIVIPTDPAATRQFLRDLLVEDPDAEEAVGSLMKDEYDDSLIVEPDVCKLMAGAGRKLSGEEITKLKLIFAALGYRVKWQT